MTSVVLVVNWLMDSALVSHPTLSAVPGMARLVPDLVLETAVRQTASVEAAPLTVDRAGKFTIFIISVLLLILLL